MLIFKLLFFIVCLYIVHGSNSMEEFEPLRNVIKLIYETNKLGQISDNLESMQEKDLNVTLVGRQNIYGTNGELVEIRTVELHIPQIVKDDDIASNSDSSEEDDDGNGLYQMLAEHQKTFGNSTKLGMPILAAAEEYKKNRDVVYKAYLETNLLYIFTNGINVVNKTIKVNSSKVVDDHIKELQAKGLSVAVQKYDANGKFLSENSTIIPEYVTTITDVDGDVDQELLEDAQKGLATVYLKYQNDKDQIPEELAKYLSEKHPLLDFIVCLNEPRNYSLYKDFQIQLFYDLDHWGIPDKTFYSIIGREKKSLKRNKGRHVIYE